MRSREIEKIRDAIRSENYDMTFHAYEEMAEDNLSIFDIENAILNGQITRKEKDDPRGIKFIIYGNNLDNSFPMGVVCRFKETGTLLIITVYQL